MLGGNVIPGSTLIAEFDDYAVVLISLAVSSTLVE